MTGHEGGAWQVAFSPDGSLFASGGAEDERLIVWDATSLSPLGTFPSGPRALVAFSADGRSVATNTHDGGVAIYELDPVTLASDRV